jgi:hypothetical protein
MLWGYLSLSRTKLRQLLKQQWIWWYFGAGLLYLVWVLVILFGDRTPAASVNYIPTFFTRVPILEISVTGFTVGSVLFARQRQDWRDGMVLVTAATVFVLLMLVLAGSSLVTRGQFHISQNWTKDHFYNLAADYENFYYLYECDPLGMDCRLVFSLDLSQCINVDLPIDPNTQRLYIRGDCGYGQQIIDYYEPTP